MFLLKYYQLKEYRERLCNVSFIIKHPLKNCTLKVRQEKSNSLGAVQIEVATFYVTLHKPAPHHTMGSLKIDT